MTDPVLTTGRRVSSFDEIELAGDYQLHEVTVGKDVKRALTFLLPIHQGADKFDHASEGSGIHMITEPPWTFRECDDGSVEVRASILCGRTDDSPGYWHGYLDEGNVWRQLQ